MNPSMNVQRSTPRIASILAVTALALGLSACSKNEDATVGERLDSAVEKTEQAAADARVNVENAMNRVESKIEQSAANAETSTGGATADVKNSIEDATITAKVNASLAKDPDLSAVQIDVDTVAGKVTLNGPAPSTTARDRAETLAKSIEGVTAVDNQLVVSSS